MTSRSRLSSLAQRYGVAGSLTTAAIILVGNIPILYEASSLFPILGTVFFAAWYGGLGPGLFATLLATFGAAYHLMAPRDSPSIASTEDVLRLTLFTATAMAIALFTAHGKRAHTRLLEAHDELKRLSSRMENVREEERAALAHDIHDDFGGTLALMKIHASSVQQRMGRDVVVQERMAMLIKEIDQMIEMIHRLSMELRPSLLDHVGLSAAIEVYLRERCHQTGLEYETHFDAEVAVQPKCALALFRVFQEALMNVIRHAAATKVTVSLSRTSEALTLTVVDNGVGVQEEQLGQAAALGLLSMKERVRPFDGTVTISGLRGLGTTVTAAVPARYYES